MDHDPLAKGENHNAIDRNKLDEAGKKRLSYYPMVNGDLTDSWKDMDKSSTILNWQTADKREMNALEIESWEASLRVIAPFFRLRESASSYQRLLRRYVGRCRPESKCPPTRSKNL